MSGLFADFDCICWKSHHMDESRQDSSRGDLMNDAGLFFDLRDSCFWMSLVIFAHDE